VSRHHATLTKKGDDEFTITCKGANPIVLNDDSEISAGDSASVKPGDKVTICSYELMIQQ
jgi:pSer/pThr/pTyr-binding forkhead associated (FHA) protein